jgi:tRNA pseudouridine32 synthase / 23S rRNA pseudouridine746 synthase
MPAMQGLPADDAHDVRYEDEALVVAVKPAGLLAVPGRGDDKQHCLLRLLDAKFPGLRVVHRLDMATSGLMVFARNLEAQRRLSAAFAERRVHKTYVALVSGAPPADQGQCELPLIADWPERPKQKVDAEHGRPALTRWQVMAREREHTRLSLTPVTGRSHQLRVHCAASGFPIVGDALYGGDPAPRLMLHAAALALAHPLHGQGLTFEDPCPF